jgi:hypothetical protein
MAEHKADAKIPINEKIRFAKNTSFLFFDFFCRTVDLGSGVTIDVPAATKRVILTHRNPKEKNAMGEENKRIPKKPAALTITKVDGVEIKVERNVIRYEKLEDVFDELPDFVQEILKDEIEY